MFGVRADQVFYDRVVAVSIEHDLAQALTRLRTNWDVNIPFSNVWGRLLVHLVTVAAEPPVVLSERPGLDVPRPRI